jgi:hypothetical protein
VVLVVGFLLSSLPKEKERGSKGRAIYRAVGSQVTYATLYCPAVYALRVTLFTTFTRTDTGIYISASLLLINIVSGEATLLSFSKRTIIYTINTEKEIYTLKFSKVQYLLNYSINIFRAKKLLNRGNI